MVNFNIQDGYSVISTEKNSSSINDLYENGEHSDEKIPHSFDSSKSRGLITTSSILKIAQIKTDHAGVSIKLFS